MTPTQGAQLVPDEAARVLARHNVHVHGPVTARPMVFAHGFGCDQSMWRFVAPAFEADHRVVLLDHVGAGGSDLSAYDEARYDSLDGYADDLVELCTALDLQDAVVVAHSVSSMIAVIAAARTTRIGALVLVGPSPRYVDDPSTGYTGGFSRADIDGLLETMSGNYLGWAGTMGPLVMGNPDRPQLARELTESFCRTEPTIARQFAEVTFLSDNRDDLAAVRVPTLVVQATRDAIAPVEVGRYVHEHVVGSRLAMVETTGHCPHLSAPEQTVAAVRGFLAEL
ncbi:alpha/beta fold hydrolase [Cellulomonas marina]|uniref:Sigma-B regulation protein RsbQ n=1 Tax=Cellulomonas marina TaxID=988821 RepID=A0A1I0Z3M2_9CELL|nr:alpha/beta hydrolase [Cellulomonas marina]GIG28208.1 hydrolase [Cellulomonas marina]SFB19937.1 sigma-B regulation protein RsbQ [Cellulomonas marina]